LTGLFLTALFKIARQETVMTTATTDPNPSDLSADDYVVVGLATCFIKAEGEIHQVKVAEPIPSAALEAILKGIPTSYEIACATTLGAVLVDGAPQMLAAFPAEAQFCDEFANRAIAAARTYKARSVAQEHIPQGATRRDFNFSLERKRVLNSERIIKAEDNVKQHAYTHQVL
jgi:predicted metal-dependent peptidase